MSTAAATKVVQVVTASASCALVNVPPSSAASAYAVPAPRAASRPHPEIVALRVAAPGGADQQESEHSGAHRERLGERLEGARLVALASTRSRTGANPRVTTVVTLTPFATTPTKKSSWNIEDSSPVRTTLQPCSRRSARHTDHRRVAVAASASAATAAIAR